MGFYFRKSKSMGPFRFNLSKSGVGVSTGVKGARVSFGPRGTYVNLGRNGLYYRQKIGGKKRDRTTTTRQQYSPERVERNNYNSQPISRQIEEVRVLDNQINESEFGRNIRKDINRSRVVFWLWIVLLVVLLYFIKEWAFLAFLGIRVIFNNFFVARIDYDLDEAASAEWMAFCESILAMKKSKKIWMIDSSTYNSNRKVQAGAYRNVNRSIVQVKRIPSWLITKFRVMTDVPKVMIAGQNCDILFLPSDVIVKRGSRFYTFPYEQLRITDSTASFIEHSRPENDVEVTSWTWQYVNKDGSPDRRYKNNNSYPVCKYGLVNISAGDNLRVEVHTSNNSVVRNIGSLFRQYRSFVMSLPTKQVIEDAKEEHTETPVLEKGDVASTMERYDFVEKEYTDKNTIPTPLNSSDIYKEAAAYGASLFSDFVKDKQAEDITTKQETGAPEALNENQFADLFSVSGDDQDDHADENSDGNKTVDNIMNFFE